MATKSRSSFKATLSQHLAAGLAILLSTVGEARPGEKYPDAAAAAYNYVLADVARDYKGMTALIHPKVVAFANGPIVKYMSPNAPKFDVATARMKVDTEWPGGAASVHLKFSKAPEGDIDYEFVMLQDDGGWKVVYCHPSCVAPLYLEFIRRSLLKTAP